MRVGNFLGIPSHDDEGRLAPGTEVEVAQMGYWLKGTVAETLPWNGDLARTHWVMVRQPYYDSAIEVESLREHVFPAGTLEAHYGKPADNANATEFVNGQLDLQV